MNNDVIFHVNSCRFYEASLVKKDDTNKQHRCCKSHRFYTLKTSIGFEFPHNVESRFKIRN